MVDKDEVTKLWQTLEATIKRLDEISDERDIEKGELYPDEIPEGQVLSTIAIAYSITFIDEDNEPGFMPTYMIPPGVSVEAAYGVLGLAMKQIADGVLSDS